MRGGRDTLATQHKAPKHTLQATLSSHCRLQVPAHHPPRPAQRLRRQPQLSAGRTDCRPATAASRHPPPTGRLTAAHRHSGQPHPAGSRTQTPQRPTPRPGPPVLRASVSARSSSALALAQPRSRRLCVQAARLRHPPRDRCRERRAPPTGRRRRTRRTSPSARHPRALVRALTRGNW